MLIGPSLTILAQSQLTSLRQLHLVLNPNAPKLATDASTWVPSLVHFIGLLPNLSRLALEFQDRDNWGRFSRLCTLLRIPGLEALTLGWTDCTSIELTFFLLRHRKTLREVNLNCINLTDGVEAWRWLVETIRDSLNIDFFSMAESLAGDVDLVDLDGRGLSSGPLEATDVDSLCDIVDILSCCEVARACK